MKSYRRVRAFLSLLIFFICNLLFNGQLAAMDDENEHFSFPHFFSKVSSSPEIYDLRFSKGLMRFTSHSVSFQVIEGSGKESEKFTGKEFPEIASLNIETVQIEFEGYDSRCRLQGIEPLASRSNYFYGNNSALWSTDNPNMNAILYNGLYMGINLKYYVKDNRVKYDFTIQPGSKPEDIRMKYNGIKSLEVDASGTLLIKTSLTTLRDYLPKSFQIIDGKEVPVAVKYKLLEHGLITFEAEEYDERYPLIIDPVLLYSTYVGGNSNEYQWVGGIDHDASGNIYHTGRTFSFNFPTTPGVHQTAFGGSYDIYVFKLNATGTALIYSTFIGGSATDAGYSIRVEQSTGNVWIVGSTDSPGFPVSPGAFQTSPGGTGLTDAIVLKLDATGSNILYSTLFGLAYSDYGHGIAIDNTGDVYITGESNGIAYTSAGAFQTTYGGGTWDGWIVKFDPTLSTVKYSTLFGGSREDVPIAIEVDANHDVYIAGFQNGGGMPTVPGSFDVSFNGGSYDAFVAKFNSTLSAPIYSTYLGTAGTDMIWNALQITTAGEAIVGGFAGNGFPTTAGAYQSAYGGGIQDVFVAKLNATGTALVYSTYIGGPGDDEAYGIYLDGSGEVYIGGFCQAGYPVTICTYDSTHNGGKDAFISKLNQDGTQLLFSSYIGGSSNDLGYNITVFNNIVYLAGETQSVDFPVSAGAFDATANGGRDLFVLAMAPSQNIVTAGFNNAAQVCLNQPVQFNNTSLNATAYYWNFGDGNGSQLQDPVHSFSIPGTYSVQLIATAPCSDPDTIMMTVTVMDLPQAQFTGSANCGLAVNFVNSSTNASGFSWDFGDGSFSSSASVVHQYSDTGTYSVKLIVSNGFGCADTVVRQVIIKPDPVASFNVISDPCKPIVTFQNNSLHSNGQFWVFGDGNASIDLSPVHTYSSPGTYYVTLVTNPNLCPDTLTKIVNISQHSRSEFTTIPACDLTFSFINQSTLALTYSWDFGDGNVSIAIDPVHVYTNPGNYFVSLISTDQFNCKDTIFKSVSVSNDPVANFSFVPPVCTLSVSFQNSSLYANNYMWDFGDGFASTELLPSHTFPASGDYLVKLIADPAGCPDTIMQSVHVQRPPDVSFISSSDCNLNANFINTSDSVDFYLWDFGDGYTDNAVSPVHQFAAIGKYDVKFIGTNLSGCMDSSFQTLNMILVVPADFTYQYDTCSMNANFHATENGFVSSLWDFGDGNYSSAASANHSYQDPGNFYVTFITNEGTQCADSTIASLAVVAEPEHGLYIPNCFTPNGDGLNEVFEIIDVSKCEIYHLMIFDRWGELIFETDDLSLAWDGKYKGNFVQEGVYAWLLKSENTYKKGAVTVLK